MKKRDFIFLKYILIAFILINFIISAKVVNTNNSIRTEKPEDVALKFINDYVDVIYNKSKKIKEENLIKKNDRVTSKFKELYEKWEKANELLLDETGKKLTKEEEKFVYDYSFEGDAVLGLQDYPSGKYKVQSYNSKTGYVILKNGDNFSVTVKMIDVNGKWCVDGAGIINIPENMQ